MTDAVTLAALALLLLGKKKPSGAAAAAAPSSSTSATDGAKLLARANQKSALQWAGIFMDAGATPPEASAMARWAGLESSGDPTPMPPGNGGGLMQVGKGFVDMGALTAGEYARLTNPSTPSKEQAVLAIKYVRWCADQSARLVGQLPANPVDRVWWAYWYQQRPVDVRDVLAPVVQQLGTTDAATIADALAPVLAKDAAASHRLRAANVVAFDAPGAVR